MIAFTGPRELHKKHEPLVSAVVDVFKRSNVAVGCAGGLDEIIVDVFPDKRLLNIFAAFGQNGEGAAKKSNVSGVMRAAGDGATVHWWAGGGASVNLTKRLSNRSLSMTVAVANSEGMKGIIGFPDRAPSSPWVKYGKWYSCHSGTWGTIATAASIGLPVVIFPCGDFSLPDLPIAGRWDRAGDGIWADAWKFKTEAA